MKPTALALFLIFLSTVAFAHDTWVVPDRFRLQPPVKVTFEVTSGMEFPKLDSGPKPERVARSGLRLGGESKELTILAASKEALKAEATISQPGLVVAWLQFKPREITLTEDQVEEYFEEAQVPEPVRKEWASQKGKTPFVEFYTKCAKTIFFSGDLASASGYEQPVGLALEIIPLTDPATFQTGKEASFRLLREGKPLAGVSIALHESGTSKPERQTTDGEGRVRFRFTKLGSALLATVHLRPPGSDATWQSEFSTLTFDVAK